MNNDHYCQLIRGLNALHQKLRSPCSLLVHIVPKVINSKVTFTFLRFIMI